MVQVRVILIFRRDDSKTNTVFRIFSNPWQQLLLLGQFQVHSDVSRLVHNDDISIFITHSQYEYCLSVFIENTPRGTKPPIITFFKCLSVNAGVK